jgi:hypothetical protein
MPEEDRVDIPLPVHVAQFCFPGNDDVKQDCSCTTNTSASTAASSGLFLPSSPFDSNYKSVTRRWKHRARHLKAFGLDEPTTATTTTTTATATTTTTTTTSSSSSSSTPSTSFRSPHHQRKGSMVFRLNSSEDFSNRNTGSSANPSANNQPSTVAQINSRIIHFVITIDRGDRLYGAAIQYLSQGLLAVFVSVSVSCVFVCVSVVSVGSLIPSSVCLVSPSVCPSVCVFAYRYNREYDDRSFAYSRC